MNRVHHRGFAKFVATTAALVLAILSAQAQAPTNLTATVPYALQAQLSWQNTFTNPVGFKIERSLDGTNFTQVAQVSSNTTTYLNTGLFPNETYFYRVRAFDSGGNSPFSGIVSAGTLALCPTNVVGWGYNNSGQASPPAGLTGAVAVAAGYLHSIALNGDGTVVGWGDPGYSTPPGGLTGVVAIAAGIFHNLAVQYDGTVVTFGAGPSVPVGLSNVVSVAAGYGFSLSLGRDGTVAGWGINDYGQSTVPADLSNVVAVAAGGYHSLALKSDGTVVAWGRNDEGQTTVPSGLTGVVGISAGFYHSLALKSDGTVVGWGLNSNSQATPPVGLSGVIGISAGGYHSLALKRDGNVTGWGYNGNGQTAIPAGLNGVASVSAGFFHNVALPGTLGMPTNFKPSAVADTQVNLSWSYTGNNQSGFQIERALDSGGSPGSYTQLVTVASNTFSYADSGLTTNTTYWYRLNAFGCANSPSVQVKVHTAPPSSPTNLTATVTGPSRITVSWVNDYADVTSNVVERALDAGGSPGSWSVIATIAGDVFSYSDTTITLGVTYWYRVSAQNVLGNSPYSNQASATAVAGIPVVILDDVWSNGTRNVQDPPTRSAWWTSSTSNGPLSANTNGMTMLVPGASSAMIITYFTPSTNSPPVTLNVGDTLRTTMRFIFNGIPTVSSASQGFRIGLFNFNEGGNSPKRVSSDGGFSSSSQGLSVNGYALFEKMYTSFADATPIDIRKRTNLGSASLLGTSGDFTSLANGGGTATFSGFSNLTQYSLQFVLKRTNLTSTAISMTWSNFSNGATLSVSTADNAASNFGFDGFAYRPSSNTQAPATNLFKEVKVELISEPVAAAIVTGPQNLAVNSGQTAAFTVVPNGTLPLYYQWFFNTNTPIPNATNSTLSIVDAQTPDAGSYSVLVSNAYGSATSSVASLTVNLVAPTITAHPQSLTVLPGQSATFNVSAVGSEPFSYRWYFNTNTVLPAATNNSLTIPFVLAGDAGTYSVVVSNFLGSVTSSNAVLTVNTNDIPPVFLTQPVSATVFAGDNASFNAYAVGPQPISYQWNKNAVPILGATSTVLNLTGVQLTDASNYTVTASNYVGSSISSVAVLTVNIKLPPPLPVIPTNQFNILDFGGFGNGSSNNASAIQNTINAAVAAGGGIVVVPTNGALNTYLSGPIVLSNSVALQINSGATLKMLPRANWPGTTTFITGAGLHDVAITGTGTLHGNAGFGSSNWWPNLSTAQRPDFINFSGCTRVLIEGVTLQNPPAFHLMLKGNNVALTIQNITINTPGNSPNTDGMDLGSTNVLIQNCSISCGDDNIQMGSSGAPAADISVSNCFFGTGHGVSIGSPTQRGVHDLIVSNCTFSGTDYGIRMKSDRNIGGLIEKLKYLDITMTNVDYPIVIYSYYNFVGTPNSITPEIAAADPAQAVIDTTPIWRNITISNLTVTSTTGNNIAGIIWGLPEMLVSNVTLANVNIAGPTKTFDIYNARAVRIFNSNLTAPSTTNTLTLFNAEVTVTNSTISTNLFTLDSLGAASGSNTLSLFSAKAATSNPNVLGSNPLLTMTRSTLGISNNLSLAGATVLNFGLSANPTRVDVAGNLSLSGTLNVSDVGGLANGSYTVFSYAGALTGFGLSLGATPAGHNYALNTNTAGQVNLIVSSSLSPFEQWQEQYFSCTNCSQAASTADPDGDGMNNLSEFLASTDPTNAVSAFRIVSILRSNNDLRITWTSVAGKTNALERTTTALTNFTSIFMATNITGTTTNYLDVGAVTNAPAFYYRVRVVP